MGAKAPSKQKLRRPTYKCDVCARKFLSAQALRSHKICVHEMKTKRRPMKDKVKLNNLLGKAVKKPSDPLGTTSRISNERVQKQSPDADIEKSKQFCERKIEFECPQCLNLFDAYCTAYRHIQKNHCINDKGKKVLSNAADLIKPVRVETCLNCDIRVRPNTIHLCSERYVFPNVQALTYVCAGCKQRFTSIQLFDLHVSGVHCDGIESFFFPTLTEFTLWKESLEAATDTKYLVLGQCSTKQMYRCTHLPPMRKDNDKVAYFCPATIVTREYSKGIQIHFYKQHHGHRSKEYNVPEEFKKYTITTLMQNTKLAIEVKRDKGSIIKEETEKEESSKDPLSDDTDLYVQYKTLMDSLVIDAAKMNVQTLKVLISKALEMSKVVSQYVEDEELGDVLKPTYLNKNMSDNEIVDALECFKKNMKMKQGSPAVDVKNNEDDDSEPSKIPKIVNTFSLAAESKDTTKTRAKKKVSGDMKPLICNSEKVSLKLKSRDKVNTKEPLHVDKSDISTLKRKNIQIVNNLPDRNVKRRISIRKDIMPEISDSSKSIKAAVDSPIPNKAIIDSPKSIKAVVESPTSISSFNDSYKDFVVKNFKPKKKVEEVIPNNNIVPTTPEVKTATKALSVKNNTVPIVQDQNKSTVEKKVTIKKLTSSNSTVPIVQNQNKSTVKHKVANKKMTPSNRITSKTVVPVSKTNSRGRKSKVISKKKVMKTKIGQYKPSLSPTKTEPAKVIISPYSTRKVKPDFEYEVKKQENDCNILILKF